MDTTTKTPKACIGDMFPSVFPGMPMFAYVPNPYDCGRPAKVYPGDIALSFCNFLIGASKSTEVVARFLLPLVLGICLAGL